MKKINFQITAEVFDWAELPAADQQLMEAAREALQNAYAPYSRFQVGAAVLLDNGTVVKGNNQENAAYPSGLCAERTAFFATGANHPGRKIVAVAVAAKPADSPVCVPVSPCGACRQVMLEYELKQPSAIRVLVQAENDQVCVLPSVASLLPMGFSAENLL